MNDNVDILLAVKNGSLFLDELIESLFLQTYSNFHLLIRDNASTDKTPALLKKWKSQHPDKITFIEGDKDLGVIGNFSTLLEHSQAPYVMFCDGDDVWLDDKIAMTLQKMQEGEKLYGSTMPILVYTDLTVVDRELQLINPSFWAMTCRRAGEPIDFANALAENKITGCTMMLNRALADRVSPIPLDVPMHDAWISLVAGGLGKIIPLPQATILYRQHGNNDSGAQSYTWRTILNKLRDPAQKKKRVAIRRLRIIRVQHFLERFKDHLSDDQKNLVNVYLSLPKASWVKRGYLLSKYNLWETGLWRKVYQVLH